MRCVESQALLPALAAGDLNDADAREVAAHVAECEACSPEAARHGRVQSALGVLAAAEPAPPPYLLPALLDDVREREASRTRRLVPVPPMPPQEIVRVLSENKEAIASAAGAAVVTAGAAWALWRAMRSRQARPAGQPG